MRVMSYNIKNATPTAEPKYAWVNRKAMVAKMILDAKPVLVGLQEVTEIQRADFAELLPDYKLLGKIRDEEEYSEYSSIAYRPDALTLLASDTFWLSETPEVMSKTASWNAGCYRVATWGKFQLKSETDGKPFIFMNTHLDNVSTKARAKGIQVIKKFILAQTDPVILTGDFNGEEDEPFYATITEISGDSVAESPHHLGLIQTCTMVEIDEPFELAKMAHIDYVFHSPHFKVARTETRMESFLGQFASDHFPVIVDFK